MTSIARRARYGRLRLPAIVAACAACATCAACAACDDRRGSTAAPSPRIEPATPPPPPAAPAPAAPFGPDPDPAAGLAATVPAGYRADLERLCDAMVRSGADQLPPGDRALAIAMWLGPQLTTAEAHAFLVRIQPLVGEPKAEALEAEARRAGLAGCALAAEWR